jgi:hypothetical protein
VPYHRKLALAAEILITYVRVHWGLRRHDLETLVRGLRDVPLAAESTGAADLTLCRTLARAVVRTLAPLPVDSRCLTRSLVLTRLLARRGIDSQLVVAVAVSPEFQAHAWVEADDTPLLEPGPATSKRLVSL